jgi:hypothetical protein
MSDVLPSKEKGHLAVAAIRILSHQLGRPPSPSEIGELVDWGDEETHVVLRGLVDAGILQMHETPFEAHFEIADHLKLEALVPEAEKAVLRTEVDAFQKNRQSKQKKMEKLLTSGGLDKKKTEEMEALEKQFADFKKKGRRPPI